MPGPPVPGPKSSDHKSLDNSLGGIAMPSIPDRGPPRVSHRSHYVVPDELSEIARGPYIHHISSSEGTYSSESSPSSEFTIAPPSLPKSMPESPSLQMLRPSCTHL
ncbi:hypothetical protein FRC11_010421 [Ceratobasidium sp. 423]|nr:hypothetical protein FRC11_010421 [Ceratobasidium sp. 423]